MIARPPYEKRLALKQEFDRLISNVIKRGGAGERTRAIEFRANSYWGGYTKLNTWPGSCGNKEWVQLADHNMPSCCENGVDLAYWMLMIRKVYKKYRLGNLFYSYPTLANDVATRSFQMIHDATKVLKLPRITRSQNPNYPDTRYQDVYLLAGDIL